MKKIALFFLTSLITIIPLFSQQIRSFTSDSAIYLEEIKGFTDNYISDDEEQILSEFIKYWNSSACSPEDRNEIIRFSNLLLKKSGRPSPHFINYYEIVLLFSSGNFVKYDIPEWKQIFQFFLESRSKSLKVTDQFLKLTLNLVKSNTLYNSSATIWRVPQSNFRFKFNEGTPAVLFENVDLICNAKRDSIFIFQTSGILDPDDMGWSGTGGRVTWERAGFEPEAVYADLSKYSISLQKTEYKADSVVFHYKKYFDAPVEGRLEERVMQITKPENALYPKFYTYQNKYILPGLFEGINFLGGLSMQGAILIGTGNQYEPATLEIYEQDTLRMHLKTNQILILENGMRSASVSMTMYLETDSIYHPDLQFNFLEKNDELRFTKSQSYTSGGPYKNTYHKIDMNFDEWLWKRNSGEIFFKPITGTQISQATFESNSFFNYEFYESLQGMSDLHPLVGLWQYGRKIGFNQFPATNYANYLGIDDSQVRQLLMKLSRLGFIFFDDITDMVRISEKLNYFLDASIGKTDYDVIYFTSKTYAPQENARLDLRNFDLYINGIESIFLSDSQNVVLVPDKNQIIMKRNRNFQFNGTVRAGLFTYFGNNFFFDYNAFKLNLQNIDSLNLMVKTNQMDNYGQPIIKDISNYIEQVTGELLIDAPDNKSGLTDNPEYPIFTSRENSFVYFNEREIQNGVYSKKDFYFVVYPFTIDSLDNFSQDGMQLPGRFESAGILPPLEQTLSLRNDFSLGFYYKAPPAGVPLYGGKGTFYNDVELSGRGLHAYGQLDYLTSTTYSDDFLMHPDSLMAISRDFMVRKQTTPIEFPKVNSSDNQITWLTKKDQFYSLKRDKDFTMFNDSVRLNGDLILEPKGLSGRGRMNLVEATIGSDVFTYKSEKILSDSADFRLASPGLQIPSMNTDNVNLEIDFTARKGEVHSNDDATLIEFQENRYISNLDFFNWDMMKKEIDLGLSKKAGSVVHEDSLSGARYISVHPEQDSLSFVSEKTIFDYKNLLLNAQKVPYIQVADARIFPNEGKLTVERNAVIRRLTKAGILADFYNRFYQLYNGSVNILTRNDYTASADYDYIDENKKAWKIHFNELNVDTSVQTIGKSALTVIDSFMLSPYFEYQGEVRLAAKQPYLTFDGASRLIHSCQPGRSWLKFEAEINPDSILIPVSEEPIDINLKRIYAGTMISRDSTHIYSTFLSGRKDYFDSYLTHASGFLRYDKYNENFEIGALEKLADKTKPGNYLKLGTDSCYQFGEGQIDFNVDYGQLKINATGQATHDMEKNTFESNVMMGFDFLFSAEALALFSKELDSLATLKAYDLTNPVYRQALRDYIGTEEASVMESDLSLYGAYKAVPENFKKNLILSDIKLKWNQNTRSFRYHGTAGIIRAGDKAINKEVEVYIELSNRGSGDLLDVYFQVDPDTYYYFGYNPGSFQVTSSNSAFNSIVYNLKDTDRRLRVKAGDTGYIYALAPDRRVELFLRRYFEAEDAEKGDSE